MGSLNQYTCEQVFRLLDQYVDRELGEDEVQRVEEHLGTCAQCAREYRFEATLLAGLKEKIRRIDVPPSVIQKVESVLKDRRIQEPNRGDEDLEG